MAGLCTRCGAAFDSGDRFCAKCGAPRGAGVEEPAEAPSRPSPSPSSKSAGKRGPLLFTLGLFLFIGLIAWATDACGSTVAGDVTVSGGPHGAFTFAPTGCASMQPYGKLGVNIHGDLPNDGAVYVTLDHRTGKLLEVEVPGSCREADGTDCTVFTVPRDRCSRYEAVVEPSGTVVNGVRLMEGHLRVECELEDGTKVRGQLEYGGC